MQTRSKGNQNLIPCTSDINLFSRPSYKSKLQEFVRQNRMDPPGGPNNQVEQPARLIGAGDAPNICDTRYGIVPPVIERESFDVKNNLLQAVQNSQFNGLPLENPIGHLSQFTRLCELTKVKGVSEDALKLRLFPFSLGGAAARWEMELPPGSITTWDQCRKAFLAKFFTPNRTAKIRTQISSFAQGSDESFSEAWERFKRYQSECPHHNFAKDTLLSTFYRGLTHENRRVLDTASQGNFLKNEVEEGWELIDNMANADSTYGADSDRTIRAPIREDLSRNKELKALSDKLDKLILSQQRNQDVSMVGEIVDFDQEQLEEVSYIQNNGNFRAQQQPYYNQYKPHPNLSYRNPNVANPQDQTYPTQNQSYPPRPFVPRPQGTNFRPFQPQVPQQQLPATTQPDVTTLLNQIIKGQNEHASDLTAFKTEVNRKIDASHAELSSRLEQLTSRVQYLEGHHDSTSTVKVTGQLPGKAIMNPKEFNVNSITLCSEDDTSQMFDEDTFAEDSNVQKRGAEQKAEEVETEENLQDESALDSNTRHSGCRVSDPDARKVEKPVLVERKVNPFPDFLKPSCLDKYKSPFQQQITEPIDHEFNTVGKIGSTMLKYTDPGEVTLTCSIGSVVFPDCVVDTGAGINTIALEACERFGFQNFKPCGYQIRLADYRTTKPYGMLEDVQVNVGGVIVPTDFAVWDIPSANDSPILFGRPFLKSARATIDMTNNQVVINAYGARKFVFEGHAHSMYEEEQPKRIKRNPHITFLLEPSKPPNDGVIEYTVRGGREPMPHERFTSNRFGERDSLGPFSVSKQTPRGTLAMAGVTGQSLPFNGQKVQLHIVETRRNQYPPPRDFF